MNKTELSCIELSEFFVSVAAQIYHPDMRRKPRNPVSVITLLKTQRQSLCPVITAPWNLMLTQLHRIGSYLDNPWFD